MKKVVLKNFAKFRVSFLNKVAGLRLAQNTDLLKQANFLTYIQKNKSKTQICEQIQRYEKSSSLLQISNFKFSILSSHFIILFNVVLPRHSSISFSNVNLQLGLALIIDYMIIFKFHVHME